MAKLQHKNVSDADETRTFPFGSSDIVRIGDTSIARINLQPGWHWSAHIQPLVGGESCQVHHIGHLISGRIGVRLDDGTETEIGQGDVYELPPGHDAWVIGDEPVVALEVASAEVFAKPRS